MTWSYSGQPGSVSIDAVRYLVGQTSSGDEVLVLDEEIDFALSEAGSNKYGGAALVCESMAARYASFPDQERVGQLGISFSDRAQKYRTQAKELRSKILQTQGVLPYVGGMEKSDVQGDRQDTDLMQPTFRNGMDSNPSAGWPERASGVTE